MSRLVIRNSFIFSTSNLQKRSIWSDATRRRCTSNFLLGVKSWDRMTTYSNQSCKRWLTSSSSRSGKESTTTTAKTTTVKEAIDPSSSSTTSSSSSSSSPLTQMWNRFIGPKEMPERYTFSWYREMALICTVFAITGSSTMIVVRPAVSEGLGIRGSLKEGPWSYRICSIVIMTPIYATLLVAVGTIFGRHHYFRHFSVKMWSRFGIPPEMIDQSFHETKKHFRKW